MSTPRRKILMQSPNDPARWEALQILGESPTDYVRTELDTKQAERYQREGGFSIVPGQEYTTELRRISDAVRTSRAPSATTTPAEPQWEMPRNAAESVARLRAQGGHEPVGVSTARQQFEDEAALAGRSLVEKPVPMDPELERRIARERERDANGGRAAFRGATPEMLASAEQDVAGFQQGLRLKGQSRQGGVPSISVGRPGENGAPRPVAALRPPPSRPAPEDAAEEVAARATPTGDEEFAAAQGESRDRALAVALSRAGARASEAISGVRGDAGVYDALAEETGNPVRDLLARREADKRKALGDPSSEQSQRFQQAVRKAMPGVYSDEEISRMSAADEPLLFKAGEMRQRLDQRAADRTAEAEALKARYAREDEVREDEQAFQRGENAKNRAARRSGGPSTAQSAAAEARLERDVQNAGSDLEGAGTLKGDLAYLDQQAAKDDIPGVGRWDSKKTGLLSVFASDDDTRTLQTMRGVVGRLLKERSGTAASDSEVERVMTELGMGPNATEQEFRVGLKRLRGDVGSALTNKQARYRPEVIDTYRSRGGVTASDIAPHGGVPAQSAPQRVVRNGKTYEFENGQWFEVT